MTMMNKIVRKPQGPGKLAGSSWFIWESRMANK